MPDTIFMIHGMWGSPWVWENFKRFFEDRGYDCVTPTLPFHDMRPDSEPEPRLGTMSLLDYAGALEREIAQLDARPIIMGHSMGGLLAQILGSRGLAKSLVLLTPAAPAGILSIRPSVLRSFWSVMMKWGFWKNPMRQTFEEAVYSMMHLLPEKERKPTYEKFVYESGRAAFEIGFWLLDPKGATRIEASKMVCPVLVVAGSEDRITPSSMVRKIGEKYKAVAMYKEFPNHAHWVLGEPGWEEIAEFISGWLKSVGTTSA